MKKLSLLFATLLVLVSSIIFCSCNDGYKDLKIECDVEVINLVLDDNELSRQNIIFELSGAKSWGEVSIVSNPSGYVQVDYEIKDNQCAVAVRALQPTGDGASLVITHLGSGKSLSIPLNIGMRLQTIQSSNLDFIVQAPQFTLDEINSNIVKQLEIPTKQLLDCYPLNYTDTIVWRIQGTNLPTGIEVVSYDKNNNPTAVFNPESSNSTQGTSNAVKSIVQIRNGYNANETFVINPVSVIKGKATLHQDVKVNVNIMDLLSKDEIKIASTTHGNQDGILEDLVLISNPDKDKPRTDSTTSGYDYYSTAVIDFKLEVENAVQIEGEPSTTLKSLSEVNYKLGELYEMKMSTNIEGLTLENVGFGKIRAIATSTCVVGQGEIKVEFVPNECVGEIETFSINIPCTVGERATSLKVSNNGESIEFTKNNNYNFSAMTALNDSTSLGQSFEFDVLSTNTLRALNGYRITINKNLLYVNFNYIQLTEQPEDWFTYWTNYYTYDVSSRQYVKLTSKTCPSFVMGEYYQIDNTQSDYIKTIGYTLLDAEPTDWSTNWNIYYTYVGGKYIKVTDKVCPTYEDNKYYQFNESNADLTQLDKYNYQIAILKDGKQIKFYEDETNFISEPLGSEDKIWMKWIKTDGKDIDVAFGISVSNIYDNSYNIVNGGFEDTLLTYNLEFNRQRTVESISYVPIVVSNSGGESATIPNDVDSDWQFYFEPTMLDSTNTFYGIKIMEVLGINGTTLTDAELGNINLKISIQNVNLGFTLYDNRGVGLEYKNNYTFNFDDLDLTGYENIILIGKTGDLVFGDYEFNISQNNKTITNSKKAVKIYKELQDEDVSVSLPTSDFEGELLQYQYVAISEKPADWDTAYNTYYEYVGGRYVQVSNATWNNSSSPNKSYYQKVNIDVLDLANTYILATSSQYDVHVEIDNDAFDSISGQEVQAQMVIDPDKTSNRTYANYLPWKDSKGNNIIRTDVIGSFDVLKNERNYIKLTYTIKANTYDYYKLNKDNERTVAKSIYVYVYEPLTFATFDKTMLYKYDTDSISNSQFNETYSKETLNIVLNNNSTTILNYIDIKWVAQGIGIGDGVQSFVVSQDSASASFTFANNNPNDPATGRIIATITQFGVQYPIYCNYQVRQPVLSDKVILDTPINSFNSGDGYINLKVGEKVQINATSKSLREDRYNNLLEVSFDGFSYIICSTTGYSMNNVARITNDGLLSAIGAGRAKLIVVAQDRLYTSLSSVTNYFNTKQYIENDASYVMIDVIVSDGSKDNPYLIATGDDFKKIGNDIKNGINDKHYALASDIDLNGQSISFEAFSGTISSFQKDESLTDNRFSIYGIMLDESNSSLFKKLEANDDGLAVLKNIDFYIDINYIANQNKANSILIGLVGENNALIENITITISGQINANNIDNSYLIGSIAALNTSTGQIKITKDTLVGVQGEIVVNNSTTSTIVLGGVIGRNEGFLQGANIPSSKVGDGEYVEYEVYYDEQGATANVVLKVKSVKDLINSAVGGVIGLNASGTMTNVYAMGKVLGQDDANNLTVNNIGGLIGKNINNIVIIPTVAGRIVNDVKALDYVVFNADNVYQIINSYSNVQVVGNQNVGGAVGYDSFGSYKKVYYEIYSTQESVRGAENVGGLIGNANNSSLYYCYVNSFAWNYTNSVETYEIIGANNVGGLIGLAESAREDDFVQIDTPILSIVNSLASVTLTGTTNVSGLVGRLNNYGAIYTAYYYGVINPNINVTNAGSITKVYNYEGIASEIITYNNVYAIVNGEEKIDKVFYLGPTTEQAEALNGFNINPQYNNGKPYIVYESGNLVSIIPTIIQINRAFYTKDSKGDYVWDENNIKYIKYDENQHQGKQRYSLMLNAMFKENNKFGDYVRPAGKYEVYNPTIHNSSLTKFSLMAELVETGDSSTSLSDYRKHALVLYYYQFSDMSGENALTDYYQLNVVDMKKIIADDGIIVLPNTFKRFNLRSSNSNVASVLSGGRLLLNGEGQVIITLISTLNPSATASFVVIVRTKVLEFNLYSSANLRDEYNINKNKTQNTYTTLNIVKGSSKLIYADYTSTITVRNKEYAYTSATNMMIDFTITYSGSHTITSAEIRNYITFNKDYYIKLDSYGNVISPHDTTTIVDKYVYRIPYGTPITISVDEYIEGEFIVTVTPYVVANYQNGDYSKDIMVPLSSYYETSFKVATKKGASAVNTDKTQLDMMPADAESKIGVKITTDVKEPQLYIEIEEVLARQNGVEEVDDINNMNRGEAIKLVEMLDIVYGDIVTLNLDTASSDPKMQGTISLLDDTFDIASNIQSLDLILKLNNKSHYVDIAFRLQVTLYVNDVNGNPISTTIYINVKPQTITSVISLNYRMEDGETSVNLDKAYRSPVIRPGETNIITIDIAPDIAVYDYVEIVDTTNSDKILFQQVKKGVGGRLEFLDNMDIWVDNGIKLKKDTSTTSTLYVLARLPARATANITHTIQIVVYNKENNALNTTYLNLEAVMYPRIELKYTYPNGSFVTVDTQQEDRRQATATADLALGVEAEIEVTTHTIDEGSLQSFITITSNLQDVTGDFNNVVRLEEVGGRYILRFNTNNQSKWQTLIGKQVNVNFTASKSLNGITETCKATIEFTIRRMVIHGVSMTHITSNNELYGYWDDEFETEFYFDYTDISYYYTGYWNVQYKLNNTDPENYNGTIRNDMLAINTILKQLNTFGSEGVSLYFVNKNTTITTETPLTEDYVDNTNGISITNKDNKFVIKAEEITNGTIDINDMKLEVKFNLDYNNNNYPTLTSEEGLLLTNSFNFNVVQKITPFDEYQTIYSQQEFEDMVEGRYYQIESDLEFTNYTPISTAIGGFNGNGYTITIKSFNIAQLELDYVSGGAYIGLFGILSENSVIQNLQVRYDNEGHIVEIDLNQSQTIQSQHSNDIYFGGIAGNNLGVITNVKVLGEFSIRSQYISADHIDLGGITAINGSSTSTKVATITGSCVQLQMSAMALIGGVSGTNYGKITNTNFKGKITSKDSNQYVAEVTTAGFVVENLSGAYISLSYVETGIIVGEYNIHSVGRTAGFVLNNAGTINNCYINQTALSSQGNIGGFVYQSTGNISNSYAYPTLVSSLFYNGFIHSINNVGDITNCYVITDSSMNIYVSGLTKISPSQLSIQSNYNGFIFAKGDDGIWSISNTGPKLLNSGFNPNQNEYDNIYNIYDVETYKEYFVSSSNIIEGKTFRIVRDIDFESEGLQDNPISFNQTLMASIEGNDMELINYNIHTTGNNQSIGLFANIKNLGLGVYVRNLILKPTSIKASSSNAVGALAGEIDGVNIYNITIDNKDLLILGKNAVGGLAGVIKGNFEIIGVTSNVSAFATYYYNIGDQYNLYMGKNVTLNTLLDNLNQVSYAGSVAGIIDGYNNSNPSMTNRNINNYYTISNITISGNLVLIGETVGGAFGLVGERTLVNNVNYNLSAETLYQGVYVSGGLVGENRGIIHSSNIYSYVYTDGVKERVNTITCFNNSARVNGAIAGVNIGGLINNCTSDIDVYSSVTLGTAGGIVGRNIEGSVYNCAVSGSVEALFAGGIAGTDYTYNTIIAKHSGFGTATISSSQVYMNIQSSTSQSNSVSYTENCIKLDGNYNDGNLYSGYGNNVITNEFMTRFISTSAKYYSFNTTYIDNISNGLVDASAVRGLVIGLSDSSYITTITCKDGTPANYNYTNKLIISLAKGTQADDRASWEIGYNDAYQTIKPIANITTNLDYSNSNIYIVERDNENIISTRKTMLLYIIAFDNASYDFWSSTLGYTKEYITLSKNA